MMFAQLNALFGSFINPVSWALVHFLWQGSVVAMCLAGLLVLLRRRSASARYNCACGALVLMVLLPVITTALYHGPETESRFSDRLTPLLTRVESFTLGTDNSASNDGDETVPALFHLPSMQQMMPWIFTSWLIGVLVLSLVHLTGWRRIQILRHQGTEPAPAAWQQTAAALCRELGFPRAVRVLKSTLVEVPTVIGWLSPVVLVPVSAFAGLSPEQLKSILAHELAHVQRRDYLVNLLQVVAETLLFYHPAVWWVSRQIRNERENCCDDIAVALSGDRIVFAQALVCLEELRPHRPGLAMGADGGSLVDRIRRLAGGHTMSSYRPNRPLLTGVILASLLLLFGSVYSVAANLKSISSNDPLVGDTELALGSPGTNDDSDGVRRTSWDRDDDDDDDYDDDAEYDDDDDDDYGSRRWSRSWDEGAWEMRRRAGKLALRLQTGKARNSSSMSMLLDEDELTGLEFSRDAAFELVREAGTFHFTGEFKNGSNRLRGEGDFTFVANDDYVATMKTKGINRLDDQRLFLLAAANITTDYIDDMAALGYDRISTKKLIEMAIHNVTVGNTRELQKLGFRLSLSDLVTWRIHGVTPDFVAEMKDLGFKNLDEDDLVSFRIHGVEADMIKDFEKMGFKRLTPDRVLSFAIHGVSSEFAEEMSEIGFEDLSADDLVSMRIHGVSVSFVKELKGMGLKNLTPEKVLSFAIHNVSIDFVEDMAEIGFTDLDDDELLSMKIHGVSPRFIRELEELGIRNLSPEKATSMKIHNVNPRFIREFHELGYDRLSANELTSMRIHGVSARFVKQLREIGYDNVDEDDLVSMKIHGVSISFIERLQNKGYDDLSIEDLIQIKIHGIDL